MPVSPKRKEQNDRLLDLLWDDFPEIHVAAQLAYDERQAKIRGDIGAAWNLALRIIYEMDSKIASAALKELKKRFNLEIKKLNAQLQENRENREGGTAPNYAFDAMNLQNKADSLILEGIGLALENKLNNLRQKQREMEQLLQGNANEIQSFRVCAMLLQNHRQMMRLLNVLTENELLADKYTKSEELLTEKREGEQYRERLEQKIQELQESIAQKFFTSQYLGQFVYTHDELLQIKDLWNDYCEMQLPSDPLEMRMKRLDNALNAEELLSLIAGKFFLPEVNNSYFFGIQHGNENEEKHDGYSVNYDALKEDLLELLQKLSTEQDNPHFEEVINFLDQFIPLAFAKDPNPENIVDLLAELELMRKEEVVAVVSSSGVPQQEFFSNLQFSCDRLGYKLEEKSNSTYEVQQQFGTKTLKVCKLTVPAQDENLQDADGGTTLVRAQCSVPKFSIDKNMSYYHMTSPLLLAIKERAEETGKPLSCFVVDLPELDKPEYIEQIFIAMCKIFTPTKDQLHDFVMDPEQNFFAGDNAIKFNLGPKGEKALEMFCSESYNDKFDKSIHALAKDTETFENLKTIRMAFVQHTQATLRDSEDSSRLAKRPKLNH